MKLLAIDSSGLVASIAVMEDENLIAEYTVNYKKTHSQTLLPMLNEVRNMIELDLDSIDFIAVAAGPGSFTGLRIGSATAKGLGLALGKPLVGVPTVDGMAFNLYGTDKLVCPIIDARRGQVYTGIYEFVQNSSQDIEQNRSQSLKQNSSQDLKKNSDQNIEQLKLGYQMNIVQPQCSVMLEDIIFQLNQLGKEVIFLGDGVPVFKGKLADLLKVPHSFAPAGLNRQRASSIGTLGLIAFRQGKKETAAEFKPMYLRLSQAERELIEKEKLIADNN